MKEVWQVGNLHELTGVIGRLTPKGAILDDTLVLYSKWFEGDRLKESQVGNQVTVLVDDTGSRCFIKKVVKLGAKVQEVGAPPAASPPVKPRRERFDDVTAVRIARSVAVKCAIDLACHGIPIGKIALDTATLERYLLSGELPPEEKLQEETESLVPPSGPSKKTPEAKGKGRGRSGPRNSRVEARRVNDLFNLAKRAKVVPGWGEFEVLCKETLGESYTSTYTLKPAEFKRIEDYIGSLIQDESQAA